MHTFLAQIMMRMAWTIVRSKGVIGPPLSEPTVATESVSPPGVAPAARRGRRAKLAAGRRRASSWNSRRRASRSRRMGAGACRHPLSSETSHVELEIWRLKHAAWSLKLEAQNEIVSSRKRIWAEECQELTTNRVFD